MIFFQSTVTSVWWTQWILYRSRSCLRTLMDLFSSIFDGMHPVLSTTEFSKNHHFAHFSRFHVWSKVLQGWVISRNSYLKVLVNESLIILEPICTINHLKSFRSHWNRHKWIPTIIFPKLWKSTYFEGIYDFPKFGWKLLLEFTYVYFNDYGSFLNGW